MRPLQGIPLTRLSAGLLLAVLLAGCQTVQSALRTTLGSSSTNTRGVLVSRVEAARQTQVEAKAQFEVTYDLFKQLTEYRTGELEDLYDGFRDEIKECEDYAEEVGTRISGIENVSVQLFTKWGEELQEITDPSLRELSQERLEETVSRNESLVDSLRSTQDKMTPIVTAFGDHVLFLKHDLNAHAIAALNDSVKRVEKDISSLFGVMQSSIKKADVFVASMSTKPSGADG